MSARSSQPPSGRVAAWFDSRLGAAKFVRSKLNYVFPENWSFLIGEIALYSFVVLVITGIFLTLFFDASTREVIYSGEYAPLRGTAVSEAYASVVELSFSIPGGLLFRQIHHWAAVVFLAAVVAHLCRVFFTGAFRRPRELNWIVGVTLLLFSLFNGFTGYSLPDDLLSGTGLRIAFAIAQSIPVVGTWAAFLIFGGEFPGEEIISRLFVTHVLLVPALLVALVALHLGIMTRQHHTQTPGPGRTEHNVVGTKLWPTYAAKSTGLFLIVFAALAALGGLAQINPVWLYGPYEPATVSAGSQPDWYVGWLEGALRVFPPWEIVAFGYMVPNPFFPAVLLPGVTFALLYAWPFLEARVSGDHDVHHLIDRPRDRPLRTAIGWMALGFYGVLLVAGANDIIATLLGLPITAVVLGLRVLLLVVPLAAGALAYRLCHDLRAKDQREREWEAAQAPGEHLPRPPALAAGASSPAPAAGLRGWWLRRRQQLERVDRRLLWLWTIAVVSVSLLRRVGRSGSR